MRAVYPEIDGRGDFIGNDVPERALEEIADRSGDLTMALLERAPEDEQEAGELEVAILAAAALDATVAGDVLFALRDEAAAEHPDVEVPSAIAEEAASSEDQGRIDDLLRLADRVFPAISGAAPDPSSSEVRARRAIAELLKDAVPVATEFGTGVLSAGAGTLVAALGPLDPIRNVVARASGRLFHGGRLIESAVEKLVGLLDMESEAGIDIGLEEIGESLSARIESFEENVVRRVIRVDSAERQIGTLLKGKQVSKAQLESLDANFNELCQAFRRNMGLAIKIRKGIRLCGPALIVVGAGVPGKAALSAAYGVGLAYCLLAVAVRLDTVPGWVPGVPTILEGTVGPIPPSPKSHHHVI